MFARTTESPILLLGAAHVVDLDRSIRSALGERALDAIAIELDAERAQTILGPRPAEAPSRRGAPLFLQLWAAIQRRLGEQIGSGVPGAEMRTAAQIAEERKIPLVLIDDPIRETLGRLLRSLSMRERLSLLAGSVIGLFLPSRLVEREIDRYSETPADYLEEVRAAYPSVTRVLLDERNEHMAERLATLRAQGYGRVAAVVGDAHVPGLASALRRRAIPVETLAFRELRGPATGPTAGASSPRPAP